MSPLITAQELHAELQNNHDSIRLVDASYSLSPEGQPPEQAFWGGRIGNSVFFDIDEIADKKNHLPHMVPKPEQFASQVGAMGIGNHHQVIVYDQTGIIMAASRVWWMFRLFGHDNVRVLNGGLPAWIASGYELTSGMPHRHAPEFFNAHFNDALYANMDHVDNVVQNQSAMIIDARPNGRYLGLMADLRPNMKSGHIPTSHNVPVSTLINPANGELWGKDKLAELFAPLELNPDSAIVTTCGSGVTACVDALALHILGFDKVAVYDGSWSEWGQAENNKPFVKHSVPE